MEATELRAVLTAHAQWLRGEGGKRADLVGADLALAYLALADLARADLALADLARAAIAKAEGR